MARSVVTRRGNPPALGRRLRESLGAILLGLASVMGLALASFDSRDPSFDHAVAAPIANLLGRPGAYGSELLLQFFGLGAVALALLIGVWGWRLTWLFRSVPAAAHPCNATPHEARALQCGFHLGIGS